jgi:hypothetical protein
MLSKIKTDVARVVATYKSLGLTASFFNFFQGRATTFAIAFTIVGVVGFFRHYDLTSYALMVTAIQGFVFAHSCKEDWNNQKMSAQATTNVINNVTVDDAVAAAPPVPIVVSTDKS